MITQLVENQQQYTAPSRVFVYLCSRFKMVFFSNRLHKSQEHFDDTEQALQGKKENHVTPLSSKSLCEHFNKTIYSSHLVPIWRSSQKLRKKPRFLATIFQILLLPPPQKRKKQRERECKSKIQLRNKI